MVDFEIHIIDDKLAELVARAPTEGPVYDLNKNIRFFRQSLLSTGSGDNCFAPINAETERVQENFRETVKGSLGSPIGLYTVKNCCILGQPGLVIDPDHRICWIGYSVGWNLEMLKNSIEKNGLGEVVDNKILRLGDAVLENCKNRSIESAHLLSLPGYAVFGHWIIDIAPRLQSIKDQFRTGPSAICAPPATQWGKEIGHQFDIDLNKILTLKQGEGVHVNELSISSCIKTNRILDSRCAKSAWHTMTQAYKCNRHFKAVNARKIYVSRSKLDSPRKFLNGREVDAYFNKLGWLVVHPEELSLQEQAEVFSSASIIAGDDGSALHNSIYSSSGTKILCLDFQRGNLLHASIANVLEHKLAYINGRSSTDGKGVSRWEMPIEKLSEAIVLLENS